MLDTYLIILAGNAPLNSRTNPEAALTGARVKQQTSVARFELDLADPQSVEYQLSLLHTENLRLQCLVAELLEKNQQLRAANCGA